MTKHQRIKYLERMGIDVWLANDTDRVESPESDICHSDLNLGERKLCHECNTSHITEGGLGNNNSGLLLLAEKSNKDADFSQFLWSKAGILIEAILYSINLGIQDVAISVTCCKKFNIQRIKDLQPKMILVFGEDSAQKVLETEKSIGELRQIIHMIENIPTIVTLHPNELCVNPSLKKEVLRDLDFMQNHAQEQ